MIIHRFKLLFLNSVRMCCLLLSIHPSAGFSLEPSNTESYIKSLIRFNSHTPVEPSWPHTGHHWLVGSSIQGATGKQKNETLNQGSYQSMIRQEWSLIKSFVYPLDTGLSYGHFFGGPAHSKPSQMNAWAQWTLWEAFGWPAFAGRVAYSKLSAAKKTKITSWTTGMQVSWGFNRVTLWSGIYQSRHSANWSEKLQSQELKETLHSPTDHQLTTYNKFYTLGLHLQIFRDFFSIAIEKQLKSLEDHYSVKLSCLL